MCGLEMEEFSQANQSPSNYQLSKQNVCKEGSPFYRTTMAEAILKYCELRRIRLYLLLLLEQGRGFADSEQFQDILERNDKQGSIILIELRTNTRETTQFAIQTGSDYCKLLRR